MENMFNYLELAADDCKHQLNIRKEEVAKLGKLLAVLENLKNKYEIQNPKAEKSRKEVYEENRISFLENFDTEVKEENREKTRISLIKRAAGIQRTTTDIDITVLCKDLISYLENSSELRDETVMAFLECLKKVKTYYPDGSYLHMSGFLRQLDEILKAVGIIV